MILTYTEFINEAKDNLSFADFAEARLAGATKISDSAKEKGGAALLTWHHFKVKLPYYQKAVTGKFNKEKAVVELRSLTDRLEKLLETFEPKDQIPFQEIMGKIEVLGELIIRSVD